jgi:SAM-dependent methyltransferase
LRWIAKDFDLMKDNDFVEVLNCRSCGAVVLDEILNLGEQPLANSLLTHDGIKNEKRFPLVLMRCNQCTTLQLSINVNPEILFSSYFWVTGTSRTTRDYCRDLARNVLDRIQVDKPKILEIGSNDGTLLQEFESLGAGDCFGIDPAKNVIPESSNSKVTYIPEFFTEDFAKRFVREHGQVDLIIARNVLSHVPDLNDVMRGINLVLSPEGTCVTEFHDANKIISETQYDSIYHEHTYYHSLRSMTFSLTNADLKPFDAYVGPISGGCIVLFSSHQDRNFSDNLQSLLETENSLGVYSIKSWNEFASRALSNISSIKSEFLKNSHSNICAFGSSARSSTLLNAVGGDSKTITGIADNNPRKWGMLSPGLHLQIANPSTLINDKVKTIFICAFNFETEIVNQLKYELNWSGEVIVPLPNVLRKYRI